MKMISVPTNKLSAFLRHATDKGAVLITDTAPMTCTVCGKVDELRPYGKDGALVCFSCGMKDEATAKAQFTKILNAPRSKSGIA